MADLEARIRRIEDELEIGQLRARYCHLLDDRRWDAFVDLFTEDGSFTGLEAVTGHAALMEFFSRRVPALAEQFWHFCTNGTVEIAGDTATGRISMEYLSVTQGVSYVSAGHYDDVMVRTAGGWRFRSRRITFYYLSPLSEGWTGGRVPRPGPSPA
ncbi:nuclear transport factor 2 family protein [Roseomonas sp. NAR14]|uniref:Nuclear transport factor 2 family protein n=1 Tax=Roseomonas acroporae TaxID=2937791 RepID=A0A9X1Y446_9PROT|nr:nuclear transport factor 2 family protein [Roseomonas acroporae]MCK8783201.1 nuclear transport factor 2 family protein [Roseomonas acroporae]